MAKIMTIRPTDELHNKLKVIAKQRGLTMNALVLSILWEWINKNYNN
ncbi:toxin-antitoxin system HicB family antitoxin [Acetobacterium wieringae]|jgi:predicted HicB family RNase H-like nuclease|uniref:Toxin-antitoxin system HicB family antitoxin n=1 Tax=Acetobacterium wieringae TaxID=52694 RepID=A0A1F2PLB7_9FIRM|nr:toxin-antitoxin system HicB family antitoxin [Acetobacterium wieringae]OFV71532.1 hypothetical protein ACWI_10320 [Acetobacterium wieringae]